MSNKRILFFAEAVTLAHVARPLVLAAAASNAGHEVTIACDSRYEKFVVDGAWAWEPLHSISIDRFLGALAKGKPFYDESTLRGYVNQDLALIERLKPDLVVGDFRLSLSVSARKLGVPYAAITNTYWSPWVIDKKLPMPVLPFTKFLPLPAARMLFNIALPFVARQFCLPLNQVRRIHGLPGLEPELRVAYTDADYVLYADSASMFATALLPDNHRCIGPILWAPPVAAPAWWNTIDDSKPVVYVTLGSSGPPELLGLILQALAALPVTVIASTAGAGTVMPPTKDIHVASYVPGIDAAARSSLVICNGGSPTAQQALAAGVPVLGIASNMDQFLNMRAVVRTGAGLLLRADRSSRPALRTTIERMLADRSFSTAAATLARDFAKLDARTEFCRFIAEPTSALQTSARALP